MQFNACAVCMKGRMAIRIAIPINTYEAVLIWLLRFYRAKVQSNACQSDGPHQDEKSPSPVTHFAQKNDCERRIAACNQKIDATMVEMAEESFRFWFLHKMINPNPKME